MYRRAQKTIFVILLCSYCVRFSSELMSILHLGKRQVGVVGVGVMLCVGNQPLHIWTLAIFFLPLLLTSARWSHNNTLRYPSTLCIRFYLSQD